MTEPNHSTEPNQDSGPPQGTGQNQGTWPSQGTGQNPDAGQSTGPIPPRQLLAARWLWIAITLVGAVRSLVQVADRDALIARLQRMAPELSQGDLDTAANGEVLTTILVALLTFSVYLLFSNRMVQGRNWARIVLTVLGGLNAVGMVLTMAIVGILGMTMIRQLTGLSLTWLDLVFGGITTAMSAIALVLMFHKDANRYYHEVRLRPRVE